MVTQKAPRPSSRPIHLWHIVRSPRPVASTDPAPMVYLELSAGLPTVLPHRIAKRLDPMGVVGQPVAAWDAQLFEWTQGTISND